MKFILANSASVAISTVIDPSAEHVEGMVFASVECVSAALTTPVVPATVLWIPLPAWP